MVEDDNFPDLGTFARHILAIHGTSAGMECHTLFAITTVRAGLLLEMAAESIVIMHTAYELLDRIDEM